MRHGRRVAGAGSVLLGLLVGMLLVTPATAHFTREPRHLGAHAWHQVIKQKVYDRTQADARFLRDARGTVRTKNLAGHAVTSGRLAPRAVGAAKLAKGAVTNPKLAMGSVGPGKIASGAVTSAKLANGAVSRTKIANGAVSAPKLAPISQVMSETGLLATGSPGTTTANCPSGTVLIGGGFDNVTEAGVATTGVGMARSLRVGNGWRAAGLNQAGVPVKIRVFAYCLAA